MRYVNQRADISVTAAPKTATFAASSPAHCFCRLEFTSAQDIAATTLDVSCAAMQVVTFGLMLAVPE